MWDYNFSTIILLMRKTYPFLIFRFLVFSIITGIAIALTGGGAGIGWLGGVVFGDAASGIFYGGFLGAGAAGVFIYLIREYVLYQVKAGHIALLVKFMHGEPVPEGKGMIAYASEQVRAHFTESNVLFLVDQLIKGVLKVITRTFSSVGSMVPIPGLAQLIKVLSKIVGMSLTYVDEIILAHYMKNNSTNVWTNSTEALVLYAQNYGKMLKNAFWVSLMVWGLTFLTFILVFIPFAAATAAYPGLAGFWTFAIAGLVAWGVKSAVIDPIAMTALMLVYFTAIQGQDPSREWELRLDALSDQFRTLKEKGKAYSLKTFNKFATRNQQASQPYTSI